MPLPSLVLLPGMDGTGDNFDPLLAVLGSGVAAQRIRYPTDRRLDLGELVDHAHAALPSVPYLVVAESFSGPVGITLAARRPPGLVGLVLVATFRRFPLPVPGLLVRTLAPALFALPLPAPAVRQALAGRGAERSVVSGLQRSVAANRRSVLASRLALLTRVDVGEALRAVEAPILALAATHDRLVPRAALDDLQRIRPDLMAHELDTAHLILQNEPAAALALIRQWWADVER